MDAQEGEDQEVDLLNSHAVNLVSRHAPDGCCSVALRGIRRPTDAFPIRGSQNLTRSPLPPRGAICHTSQPGKLRIQGRDGFCGRFQL